jgi:peptidoglycan/xylan/chitin deacetylase (PgdA/CDA1 family)
LSEAVFKGLLESFPAWGAGFSPASNALNLAALAHFARTSHLSWKDFPGLTAKPSPINGIVEEPLGQLGVSPKEFGVSAGPVEFLGKTQYLNGAKAVVSHTVDDSHELLLACLDVIDQHGIKTTAFVSTGYRSIMPKLWPRLRQAIANGHEIGSHSRRHPCRPPETPFYCFRALTWNEIAGSRDDILENTDQPHVWSWAYPCGNCAGRKFIQQKIARAGYLTARGYPDEFQGLHAVPDLQTYDSNPYAARYTQVVQKGYSKVVPGKGEVAISGRTDVSLLNEKFDEVYAGGGIYSFLAHPQMIDYGPDSFYERHLAHLAGRNDIWYVPMGPLYAFRTLSEQTRIEALKTAGGGARFVVFNQLDRKVYNGSITLRFRSSTAMQVKVSGSDLPERESGPAAHWNEQYFRRDGGDLLVTVRPNSVVEFRPSTSGKSAA